MMLPTILLLVSQVSAIATAVLAGVFLTFSDFVMRALDRAARSSGIEVMQTINREVYRTVFMVLFLGMAVLSLVIAGYAALAVEGPAAGFLIAAGLVYAVGVFGVTAARNVPMNTHLATFDHASPGGAAYWTGTYVPSWTFWNHVRATGCAVSAVLFLAAGVALAGGA